MATSPDLRRITADITMPAGAKCPVLRIRLRRPQGQPMKNVTINGKAVTTFNAREELVDVPSPSGTVHVEAGY